MGKIIFLFFLCYNAVITEKYIVIRIRDDSGNRSISNLPEIETLPLPIDVAELGPKLTSTKRLEGDYKSKSVSILQPETSLPFLLLNLKHSQGRGDYQHKIGARHQRPISVERDGESL